MTDNPYHKPAGFYKQPPVPTPIHEMTPQQRFQLMFQGIQPTDPMTDPIDFDNSTALMPKLPRQPVRREPYDPLWTLIDACLNYGDRVPDRTGTGTLELFATQLIYPMEDGSLPLCTLKATSFRNVLAEILWIVSGDAHLDRMHKAGATHWDPWLPKDGRFGENNLGRVYGVQWRHWLSCDPAAREACDVCEETDQLGELMDGLRRDPHGRRHILTAWNPGELDRMALPPCHMTLQAHVDSFGRLSLQVYQRSADLFIGVPYDVGMYAILLHMMCEVLSLRPGKLVFCFGSSHVYLNHVEQAREMLSRAHLPFPYLTINPTRRFKSLDEFTFDDFALKDYHPHPHIKAPVAV